MSFKAQQVTGNIISYFNSIRKQYDKCQQDLLYYDKEYNDLTHALEFINFNASQGYKLAEQMKINRQNRRDVKNTIEQIEPLYQLFNKHARFLKEVKGINTDVIKIAQNQTSRSYMVRVRTDLQEDFNKVNGVEPGDKKGKERS